MAANDFYARDSYSPQPQGKMIPPGSLDEQHGGPMAYADTSYGRHPPVSSHQYGTATLGGTSTMHQGDINYYYIHNHAGQNWLPAHNAHQWQPQQQWNHFGHGQTQPSYGDIPQHQPPAAHAYEYAQQAMLGNGARPDHSSYHPPEPYHVVSPPLQANQPHQGRPDAIHSPTSQYSPFPDTASLASGQGPVSAPRPSFQSSYVEQYYPSNPNHYPPSSTSDVQSWQQQHIPSQDMHPSPQYEQAVNASDPEATQPITSVQSTLEKKILLIDLEPNNRFSDVHGHLTAFKSKLAQYALSLVTAEDTDNALEALENHRSKHHLTAVLIWSMDFALFKRRNYQVDLDLVQAILSYTRNGGHTVLHGVDMMSSTNDFFRYDCNLPWKHECNSWSLLQFIRNRGFKTRFGGDVDARLPRRLRLGFQAELRDVATEDLLYVSESPNDRPNNQSQGPFAMTVLGLGSLCWFGGVLAEESSKEMLYIMLKLQR